jgi:hypothetical protein
MINSTVHRYVRYLHQFCGPDTSHVFWAAALHAINMQSVLLGRPGMLRGRLCTHVYLLRHVAVLCLWPFLGARVYLP